MTWKNSFGNARRVALNSLLAGALATGISVSAGVQQARANHNWIGPAIVGAIVGAAIIHHAHKGHHRHHVYGYPVPVRKVYHTRPYVYDYPVKTGKVYWRPWYQDMYRSPY